MFLWISKTIRSRTLEITIYLAFFEHALLKEYFALNLITKLYKYFNIIYMHGQVKVLNVNKNMTSAWSKLKIMLLNKIMDWCTVVFFNKERSTIDGIICRLNYCTSQTTVKRIVFHRCRIPCSSNFLLKSMQNLIPEKCTVFLTQKRILIALLHIVYNFKIRPLIFTIFKQLTWLYVLHQDFKFSSSIVQMMNVLILRGYKELF